MRFLKKISEENKRDWVTLLTYLGYIKITQDVLLILNLKYVQSHAMKLYFLTWPIRAPRGTLGQGLVSFKWVWLTYDKLDYIRFGYQLWKNLFKGSRWSFPSVHLISEVRWFGSQISVGNVNHRLWWVRGSTKMAHFSISIQSIKLLRILLSSMISLKFLDFFWMSSLISLLLFKVAIFKWGCSPRKTENPAKSNRSPHILPEFTRIPWCSPKTFMGLYRPISISDCPSLFKFMAKDIFDVFTC